MKLTGTCLSLILILLVTGCGGDPVNDSHGNHQCQIEYGPHWNIPAFTIDHSDSRACQDFAYTSGDPVSTAATIYEKYAAYPHGDANYFEMTPCDVYEWGGCWCPPSWELAPTQTAWFMWDIEGFNWVRKASKAVFYNAGSTTPDWVEFRLYLWSTPNIPKAVLKIPYGGPNQT